MEMKMTHLIYLDLLVLCFSQPSIDVRPHSRDFYAGYIRALNDNFDVLFSPERLTRSIKGSDEETRGSVKILNEIIDEQKLQDTENNRNIKNGQKRNIFSNEINVKKPTKDQIAASNDVTNYGSFIAERIRETKNLTFEDGFKRDTMPVLNTHLSSMKQNTYLNNVGKEVTNSSGDGETTAILSFSEDAESGGNENSSGDSQIVEQESGVNDLESEIDDKEPSPERLLTKSKKTKIEKASDSVKGDKDFEDIIHQRVKETANISDGDKPIRKALNVSENTEVSGADSPKDKEIKKSGLTHVTLSNDQEEIRTPGKSDNHYLGYIKSIVKNTRHDNSVRKHSIPEKSKENGALENDSVDNFSEEQEYEENVGIDDVHENGVDSEEVKKESQQQQQVQDIEHTVKKTITADEDNTEKVANFKEDEDIESNKPATNISNDVNNDEGDKDDVLGDKTGTIADGMASTRRNFVPRRDKKLKRTTKNFVHKKSNLGAYHLRDFPLESDVDASVMKKIEEGIGTSPLALTRDEEFETDKELLSAPEPNYKKSVPGLESGVFIHPDSKNDRSKPSDNGLRRHDISQRTAKLHYPYTENMISNGYKQESQREIVPLQDEAVEMPPLLEFPYQKFHEPAHYDDIGFGEISPIQHIYGDHSYYPESLSQLPAFARSNVMSYEHRQQRPIDPRNNFLRAPLAIVKNFLENAGGLSHKSSNDIIGRYFRPLKNGQNIPALVLSRRQYHQPVVLQPIFVLMPMSNKLY